MDNWNMTEVSSSNVTTVIEDGRDINRESDLERLRKPSNLISLFAVLTNAALLVVIFIRLCVYSRNRKSKKWTWVRLHYVGVVALIFIGINLLIIAVSVPSEGQWVAQTDTVCRVFVTFMKWFPFVGWLYLVAIGVQTFFQVYQPYHVTGRNQLIIWSIVHLSLWIVPLLFVFFTISNSYTSIAAFYNRRELRYCLPDEKVLNFELILNTCTFIAIGLLLYTALISLVGICIVKPSRDVNSQDNEMLQWIIDTRVKAAIFIVVLGSLACGLCIPERAYALYYFVLMIETPTIQVLDTYKVLEAVSRCFYLAFPFCCLILHEVGLYSLVKRPSRR